MPLIINLENFQFPETSEIISWIQDRPQESKTHAFSIMNEIKPSDLYLYLYAKFGPPNGIQNLLRNDDSDNLFHWDWTFKHENGLLTFIGMNQRTELTFIGNWNFEQIDKDQVIRSIRDDFKQNGSRMSELRKTILENWETFVNPYYSLNSSISSMEKELKELNVKPEQDKFSNAVSAIDMKRVSEQIKELSSRYTRAYGLAKSLQALTPVLAESFLNILMLLLLKKEIKDNERIKESVIRANIDVKVQSLSIYCSGFSKPVDWKSDACKNYNKVINKRNDILHGNVNISKLKTSEIFFNGRVPVFKKYSTMWEQLFERKLEASGFNEIREDLKSVREFISYVLSCLDKNARVNLEAFMNTGELGRNLDDGRLGVLLPDHIPDLMPQLILSG
tara:strand:+ start:110 stop:1285 length:1176 start_codon:yes stop_codon:yes gene_type:complete